MYWCEQNHVPGTGSSVVADDEKDPGTTDREKILLHLVLSFRIFLLQPPFWPKDIGILSVYGSISVSDPGVHANLCL